VGFVNLVADHRVPHCGAVRLSAEELATVEDSRKPAAALAAIRNGSIMS
jgi:hypothetical protein